MADNALVTMGVLDNILPYVKDNILNEVSDSLELIDSKIAQSDWEQNDETASDYIKNRPFYEAITPAILMPETQFSNLTHISSPDI